MKFLRQLFVNTCSHRFSWPRVDSAGRHYQICLDCGSEYAYDWKGMRQTGRLQPLPAIASAENASRTANGWHWQ